MSIAIPSLVSVLKPILPGVQSRAINFYKIWKVLEIFLCPILDVYAFWRSVNHNWREDEATGELKTNYGQYDKITDSEDMQNYEVPTYVKALIIMILIVWLFARIYIVYLISSY